MDNLIRKLIEQHPTRCPIIIQVSIKGQRDKNLKLLVEKDMSYILFCFTIRKRINLLNYQNLYIFIAKDNILLPTNIQMGEIYKRHSSDDGALYLSVRVENTFGELNIPGE